MLTDSIGLDLNYHMHKSLSLEAHDDCYSICWFRFPLFFSHFLYSLNNGILWCGMSNWKDYLNINPRLSDCLNLKIFLENCSLREGIFFSFIFLILSYFLWDHIGHAKHKLVKWIYMYLILPYKLDCSSTMKSTVHDIRQKNMKNCGTKWPNWKRLRK